MHLHVCVLCVYMLTPFLAQLVVLLLLRLLEARALVVQAPRLPQIKTEKNPKSQCPSNVLSKVIIELLRTCASFACDRPCIRTLRAPTTLCHVVGSHATFSSPRL